MDIKGSKNGFRKESEDEKDLQFESPKGFGTRHVQALLLFLSLTAGYTIRSQLSVSLVAMTTPNSVNYNNCNATVENRTYFSNSSELGSAFVLGDDKNGCNIEANEKSKWNVYRTYNWDKPTQEMILFSFFTGYTCMMFPMGIISQKYGGKLPIVVALGVNGAISIITPWVPIFAGWIGLCICRILQGCTQAAFFPCIHTILGKWAPLSERGRLSTYVYTGSPMGTILIFQLTGLLSDTPIFGWPSVYWFCGIVTLICCTLYAWLGSASPQEHPTISTEELIFITGTDAINVVQKRKTPWKKILTSPPIWGLITAQIGSTIGAIMVLTQIPTYMNKILGVDIKRNGLFSSLPYISMYIMVLISGYVSDLIINKKIMTVVNIRRTANTIGLMVSAVFLMAFVFVNNTTLAVIILMICLGLHSGAHVGFHINHLDVAPNFAGPIMAFGNMLSNLATLFVPILVSNIIKNDMTNQSRWQILFGVVLSIQVLANIIFVILVKGEPLPWNSCENDENKDYSDIYKLKAKNSLLIQEMECLHFTYEENKN